MRVGPAECHFESPTLIGWQRVNLKTEPINTSAVLPRELLSARLSRRANMGAPGALCLLGCLSRSALSVHNPRKRRGCPFEKGSLVKQGLGVERGSRARRVRGFSTVRLTRASERMSKLPSPRDQVGGWERSGLSLPAPESANLVNNARVPWEM